MHGRIGGIIARRTVTRTSIHRESAERYGAYKQREQPDTEPPPRSDGGYFRGATNPSVKVATCRSAAATRLHLTCVLLFHQPQRRLPPFSTNKRALKASSALQRLLQRGPCLAQKYAQSSGLRVCESLSLMRFPLGPRSLQVAALALSPPSARIDTARASGRLVGWMVDAGGGRRQADASGGRCELEGGGVCGWGGRVLGRLVVVVSLAVVLSW